MNLIFGITLFLGLVIILRPKEKGLRFYYWTGLILKLFCGALLGWYYLLDQQTGDSLTFHLRASTLFQLFEELPLEYLSTLFTANYEVFKSEARNELFVKILSILYLISSGNYWLSGGFLSLFSFLGSWYFVKTIRLYQPHLFIPAVVGFLFLPSAILWSSGVLKDPLINGCVFFLAAICIRYVYVEKVRMKEVGAVFLSLLLLFYLKHYLAAVCILVLGMLAIRRLTESVPISFYGHKLKIYLILVPLLIFGVSEFNNNLNFENVSKAIYTNYQLIQKQSDEHAVINFPLLESNVKGMVLSVPAALLTGLFRPFPGEAVGKYWFLEFEKGLLFLLFLMNIYLFKRIKVSYLGYLCIIFVLILASLLPLSAPNFGSLMRYQAAYLPFLTLLLCAFPYQHFFNKG